MTTYTLVIEHAASDLREAKAYSTAANAIDDMESWLQGGVTISTILRDGLPIGEAELRADEGVGQAIDVGRSHDDRDAAADAVNRRGGFVPGLEEPCSSILPT